MREAIGQTFLTSLVVILVSIILMVLAVAVVYSKTYKIKTKIVDIIEKHKNYEAEGADNAWEAARSEIDKYLYSIGYRKNATGTQKCGKVRDTEAINETSEQYHYCVYVLDSGYEEMASKDHRGKYYGVKVFLYFEFPIIGDILEIPVYGETEVFFDREYIEG